MTRFSAAFGLPSEQAVLDFVDVDMSRDMALFVDPYAIELQHDDWSDRCGDLIRSFFGQLLDALRVGDLRRATHLLDHLHEPNETFLGISRGRPRGRGVGEWKASALAQALISSRALKSGLLTDISEAELFIHGVGRDTISDLTTNVLRGALAEYTEQQCVLHGVETRPVGAIGPVWNISAGDWEARLLNLPINRRQPVLLVPKFSVRQRLSLESQEFWTHHMLEFLREEYLNAGSSLVRVLRSGGRRVYKKDVKERHPFVKDGLAEFARRHPEVLETYKELKAHGGPPETSDLDEGFDERAFALALRDGLRRIPEGLSAAPSFHSFAMGICTFLFYPSLICPVKELELHEGRKRVDIKYTNTGRTAFWQSMQALPQTRAMSVFVECKNYEKQMSNPELDQLAGRFGHQRGRLGLLLCRRMDDRARIVARCRDTANDDRGFILVLEDADLNALLLLVEGGRRDSVDGDLQRRFDEVTH